MQLNSVTFASTKSWSATAAL